MPIDPASSELAWRKAQSGIDNRVRVEVAATSGMIALRDSNNSTGPILTYTAAEWRAFLDGAKNGEFDDLC
jgi:hypothetical protein